MNDAKQEEIMIFDDYDKMMYGRDKKIVNVK